MSMMLHSFSRQGERIARAQGLMVSLVLTLVILEPLFSRADKPGPLTPEEATAAAQLSAAAPRAVDHPAPRRSVRVP